MRACGIKWNYSSNWAGVFLCKSSSRTKHNWYCIIGFLINAVTLNYIFILHYHLFFRKEFFFFWSSYVSEYDIRNVFLLRKEPSIKYIRNWWGMGDHPKCVQLRTGWRARQASCVRAHLHYLFSCSWQQFLSYTILFCFLFFCRNLTSIKKKMSLSETVAFRKLFLLRIV